MNIPKIGLGTWKLKDTECVEAVKYALEVGYRHIDTADLYENHVEVAAGIQDSGVKREEIFLTTKLWQDSLMPENLPSEVERFLQELQTEYLDLLLIHWPDDNYDMNETLAAMTEVKNKGVVKNIGISNFEVHRIKELNLDKYPVLTNQVEYHPSLNQTELKEFCEARGISITAYCPIGRQQDLNLPEVIEVAEKHNITPAQVCLAWAMQQNMIVIPKSSNKDRIKENFEAAEITLEAEDIEKINSIDAWNRLVMTGFFKD